MKLLALSGYIPEEICDIVRFSGYAGGVTIPHFCGYAADYIAQVREDASIDGAVFPRTCDSSRILGSYLEETGKFIFRLGVPARRDEAAVAYFAGELERYKRAAEAWFSVSLSDLPARTAAVARRNAEIAAAYARLEAVPYSAYLSAVHGMLSRPLFEQHMPALAEGQPSGKRVYLVGSFLTDETPIALIEGAGMHIVGDNFPESGRLLGSACEGEGFAAIARRILEARPSPSLNRFAEILERDLREIEAKGVRGVIFLTQKYCEPYDYLYSVYEKRLAAQNVPCLKVPLSADAGKRALAIEAFADMI